MASETDVAHYLREKSAWDAKRLREHTDLRQRIGELEGALTTLLAQAARNELMLVLSEDQYQRIRSLVDRGGA